MNFVQLVFRTAVSGTVRCSWLSPSSGLFSLWPVRAEADTTRAEWHTNGQGGRGNACFCNSAYSINHTTGFSIIRITLHISPLTCKRSVW